MILFKNPRDVSQFNSLARQMYPTKSAFAVEAYKGRNTRAVQLFVRWPSTWAGRRSTSSNERVSRWNSLCLRAEMSDRVRKYLPILKRVRRLGEKAKRQYVRKCDNEFIRCVSECAKNVIKGNVPLTFKRQLRSYVHHLFTTMLRKRSYAYKINNNM